MATPTSLPSSFSDSTSLPAASLNDLRGAFRVLQVVQGTYATFTTHNTTTYTDSGLTATITPQSTSNKVLVVAFMNGCVRGAEAATNALNLQLLRGSTQIEEVVGWGFTNTTLLQQGTCTIQVLDSPSTTSAVVYKVQGKQQTVTNSTLGTQYQSAKSTIVLMEISA